MVRLEVRLLRQPQRGDGEGRRSGLALLSRAGRVSPSAWNMPEQANTRPTATKFQEMISQVLDRDRGDAARG